MDPITKAIRDEFPGPSNEGLRLQIREAVREGIPVSNLAGSFALAAFGEASLKAVERVQAANDDRLAHQREPVAG